LSVRSSSIKVDLLVDAVIGLLNDGKKVSLIFGERGHSARLHKRRSNTVSRLSIIHWNGRMWAQSLGRDWQF
jgi:hypothetical protein